MLNEGIQEPKKNQLSEPALTFQLFTQEAKDMIWEEDESEEGEEAQAALLVVQKYALKKAEAKKANLMTDSKPEDEMAADELPELSEDEGEDDEGMDMEELKKKSGDKPPTLEEYQKYRKEPKEKREKEAAKSSKHIKTSGKISKVKVGKKNAPTIAAKKELDENSDGK